MSYWPCTFTLIKCIRIVFILIDSPFCFQQELQLIGYIVCGNRIGLSANHINAAPLLLTLFRCCIRHSRQCQRAGTVMVTADSILGLSSWAQPSLFTEAGVFESTRPFAAPASNRWNVSAIIASTRIRYRLYCCCNATWIRQGLIFTQARFVSTINWSFFTICNSWETKITMKLNGKPN